MELTGLGYRLEDLWDGYPATVVKGLLAAARIHRRHLMTERVVAMSVAVTGALDLALNQGKGRVLERWIKEVLPQETGENRKGPRMSDRAFSFFGSLPRKGGKK